MQIIKNITYSIAGSLMLFITSCDSFRCIDGNGNYTDESRTITTFNTVKSDGDFDVYITQDTSINTDSTEIIISADANLMAYIRTYVIGNTLYLQAEDNVCFRTDKSVKISFTTKYINNVYLEGSGLIDCGDTVHSGSFYAELSGSGSIKSGVILSDELSFLLTGSGDISIIKISDNSYISANIEGSGNIRLAGTGVEGTYKIDGSGDIKAQDMRLNNGHVNIDGSGNIYLWAVNSITGRIDGSGNIYYVEQPSNGINVQISGSGNIIPIN